MWCKQCQQDVPGVPSKSGKLRCLRCGALVAGDATNDCRVKMAAGVAAMGDFGLDLDAAGRARTKPTLDFDDWDLDPELRSFENARAASKLAAMPATSPASSPGFEPGRTPLPSWQPCVFAHGMQPPMPLMPVMTPVNERHEAARRASWLAWSIMSLGLMVFCCGGVLLGWSFASDRADLWSMGIPVAVGGQIALLVGLVLQLERIWQNNRYAVDKLEEVDGRLADMKHSQSLLSVNHGSAAQAFYSHMAEGANPSLLLADLKGQLDLLAVRLSERPNR